MGSFDDEDTQTLVKLGLNGSQAKIYLTIVSLGVANAKEIAQTARIDRAEIYRQLPTLQEKSLVMETIGFPNQYEPMALNEAIETLIQQKNIEVLEIRRRARELLKRTTKENTFKDEESKISIIPRNNFRTRIIRRHIEHAQVEILGYTQIERLPISLTFHYETWKRAFARGVRFRSIVELNKPADDALRFFQMFKKENPSFTVRFANSTLFTDFGLIDDRQIIFSTEIITGLAGSQMLSTNNAQLIKVIKDYFEYRWNTAMIEYPRKGD